LRKLSGALFEKLKVCVTCVIDPFLGHWIVSLLYEVDETLCSHEPLKKRLVLSYILNIVIEVKDFISTFPFCNWVFLSLIVVKVLKSIDEEDKEVEELLLDLKGKLLPKGLLLS
jgi:hypothetical protein